MEGEKKGALNPVLCGIFDSLSFNYTQDKFTAIVPPYRWDAL